MPEEKDKIKKLYDTFVSDGYDMESEEDFRKNLLDSTKRKAAYDALVKDGYDMEPFEEFESNIGFGKERTSSQQSGNSASGTVEEPISPANEQTWQPTEKEKVAMLTETDRIMNDVKSHTQTFNERIDNMQEYGINPGLQTKEGKMIFNPESGKLEKTFLTPAGNRYYSKSLADMESFQYRQAADMSIGGQLRKANLRLQELKAKQEERASEVHKEWAEETENNKAPLAAILGAATYTPRQQSDKENRALSVAIRETEELIKNLEEQKDRENGVDVGFWRGFGRTMGDVRTWDFGMGDMRDAFTMMNADELKKENATEGEREAHDAMMGAIHEKQQAEERYSGNADFWNRAGVMTGYMPSFMLDFVLTGGGFNGLSSFSKGSTRLATKVISKETAEKMAQQGFKSYIKENGAKGLGRYATDWTIKALGTTADDLLVRAPLMANTVQAGKTTADIIDRKLGDVVVDENGNYDFSNDKTWGDAIWQSEANAIIENYSEMFGAHLDPVFTLGNMSKLANVVGAKRIGTVLSKADASALNGIMGQTHQMFNKMGMSDYVGEVSEEYYGQLWRTMLNLDDAYQQNPDGTRTNLFASGQFHGDIWGGMALSMGLMGAGKHTLSAANYTSMKHGVNKADAKVNELLGKEVWEPLKETLDLTTNENIGEVAELIAGDKDFTINEKAAVLDYMERSLNLRGFNLASMAQSRGGNRNESVQQANDSYLDGYNIISSQEMNDAKNMYEYQRARVADLVDESMFAMIEENPIAALEFVNGNEQWNDEDKVSVIDYINAKQVYNGMIQRVRDDIDGRIEQSNSMIDARVNRNTGMIQGATMKQDERKVYVISGKLVPYDDGSGVSVTDSDNSIIIRDSETGALEQVSPDAVLSLDESQDPNEQKELAEQAIVEQFAREAADKIDGKVTFNPGDAYTITGQDGSQMQVQIIANEDGIVDNGDGTVNVSDGVNIFPLAKETIQQQADAANLARVAQFEQQRTIENAERKQEMQEAERPQYALNDIVSLTDENGVTVRGNITADADADGKYEVFTEAPINGKRVNLFTRDELDNMLLEHNGVAFERPVENESNNGAENIPENDNNAPQNIPAMQRIPKDEQGNPLYEQADSDTAWDAIVEQTEGDEDMAQTVADGMVADKEEALKKLEKAKSKGGNSIAEKIASEKERKAAIDAAKQELLVWQKIAGTAKRRKLEADDERRRIADEAAALRKAEEEKLRAEREEAERIEREALNGVPDMVDDKPQDARVRGYRRMNGHKIDRQEPVQALQGKEVSVKFSDDAIVGGRVAVIDVNLLQPSHIQGVRNPLHFIDEAQPKERNDEASVLSARKIAGNIRPEEITSSVTAYTGAPTVNARGEAIQGNNRSDALRIMWENHPEQAALYKQYLKDHAEEFGLQAEDIEAMEHPVLVNMVDVDDAEAAYFANYDSDWANNHKTVVTAVNLEDFKKWIDSSHRKTKAFAEYKSVKSVEEQSSSTQVDRLSEIKSRIEELHKEQEAAHGQSDIFEEARIISEINDLFTEQRKLEQNNSNEETTTPTDAAYTITQAQYTTKRGKVLDMHLVKFNNKLRDTVRKHTTMFAKQLKGWWDKEKQGFMMRSKEDAERLAEYATDAQSQPPLSLSDLSEVNDGNVQFSEPQQQKATKQEEKQEYTPIWQYSVFVDKETGETTLSRDDVSGPIPIGDARFRQTTNSPEEMLDILRNPQNGMQEVLDAVGISLENKIKTRELDRKAKDEIRDKRTDFVVDKEMDNRYSVRTLMKMIDAEKQAVMDLGEKRGGDVYHEGNIIFLTKDSADKFANEVRTLINDMRSEQQQDNSQKKTEASGNRLVTDERYAELRERMRKKLLGQMNIGIDPEILAIGTEMAVYHLEKGSRKFAEYATAMIADLGDAIRPYLKAFYNGARDLPEVAENGLDADMTPYDEVQQFDVANFDKKSIDALATAETVTRETKVEQEAEIAQERIKKSRPARKKNEKKAVNSQQSNELGLFDDLIDNNKNNEHGLQRTDAERSEGLSANGNRHGQGLSRGTETGSESEQQAGRGTDNEGERTSDAVNRIVRPRLSDAITEKKNTHNNHSERGKDHAPTSVDARIEANIKAIELAKQLLESGERATEKQMQTLRKFSGWGGLGKAFNEGTSYAPNPIAKKLRELLGEKAYQEAVMSANSAYYTPAYVVDTLWDIAEQMGFNGGNILEGSAGIGNILGQMPTNISERSDIHAIEIDGTSGGILSLLYPDAKVEIQGFEQTRIPNGSVDLAITNVPFVTGLRVNDTTGDKDLSKKFHNIHDFCIAKNVRKLREGGLGIFITSNGTLDNSKKLRDWIVSEGGADFVGAFRMHNKTFGGTGVTSDIVVIRKRVNEQKSAHAIDVSDVSGERMAEYDTGETRKVKGKETPVIKQLSMDYNRYFIEHPENMAGEMHFAFEKGDTFRPTSKGLYPKQDKKQEEMLAEFVRSFRAEEFGERNTEVITDAMPGKKIGEVFVKDGKLYINSTASAQPLEVNANKVKGHTKVECFEAYTAIKEALAEVLSYQTENESDEGLKPLLDKLNKAYDDFVSTYGHFNKNTAIAFLRNDVDYANVFALEKFEETADEKGNRIQKFDKTDVFRKRVVEKEKEPTPANVKDGIIASIFKFGRVDIPYIAEQLGTGIGEVKKEIIENGYGFENPVSRQIEASYQYLSGNIREKLRQAEENNENGEFDRNIKALQEVMPMEIPAHLIDFTLGSSWIAPKLYEDFVKERTEVDVRFTAVGGTWFMKEPYFTNYEKNRAMGVTSEMLGRTIMGHTLIEAAIQNRSITVSTTKKHYDGTTETITDKEATQACAAKIDEIRQDFKDWARQKMQSDPEMSERMERIYNDMFNNFVPMSIPDEFVPEYFGGASHKFKMRPHQGRAIVRGTQQPLLLAHEVGTGKTFTLISTAMEMRRLGTARKPMIVVQNATVGQFVASAKELYPNAKILTLEEADRSAEGRKNFYAKIRYNDWDMIVVPQSTFEFIPDSEEREMTFVQDKIEEKMLILEQMKEEDPDGKNMITRQAEREIELLEEQLAGLADNASKKRTANDEKKRAVALQNAEVKAMEMLDRRTDDVENFDDMGIDALLVDEAHEYKHLGFATAMQRGVKGVDPSYSKKSQGVFLKTQAVLEKNNGRNVIFATGTPISNTAAEIWTFMRYLMPADTMKEYGIYYFDDFVRNFGNIQQMLEFTTSGKFKENNRFAGYVNLPELVRIWSGVSDTVLTKEAGGVKDKIPEMEGGKAQDLYLPQTRALRSIMKFVKSELEHYEQMSGKEKKENSHIPLTMYGIAKAAAVDARLVQSDAEDDQNSKTNEAVRQTLRSLKETADYKGTVAIFADNYQNKQSGFNLYDDIRNKLIAEGVPADEIVVMRSGMTVKKKLEIFEKVNRGEVRVILGSTFTLGTGVNIQERLHTLIHLDAPNRPMDYTQRNGRILRQGNLHKDMNKPVRILRFGVEDSLDVTAYQRLKTKGAIADSIMNGKQMMNNSMTNRVLEEEEDVFGDTVAQLSGSEYAMLKNNAEKNVRKYASRKKQWETDQTYIHNAKPRLKAFIKDAEKRIEDNGRYLEAVRSSFPDGQFKEIVIGKHRFTSVDTMDDFFKEYNKSVLAEMKQMKDGEISGEQKRELIIQIGDFSFVVTTKLARKTMSDGATLFNDVERRMTYSCLELGIEDVPVRQNLLRNAVEDITDNVITGKDFAEILSAGERSKKHNEAELKELLSREGKPFEYEEELAQAKAQLEEYAELMKKELEEKEAKYAEMDATVETANNISTSEEDDELKREGDGAYTDDEVSYENDPIAKQLSQSRRTAKQRREFARRERQRMAERVESLAEKLHLDNVEVVTDASVLDGKKQRAKGFYSKSTGKITIVIPNHTSTFDVEQTLLHEAVAHYGLRQLFGEHFDTFLDNVFNNADENIRRRIVDMAAKNGWDFHKATEEYLASLAEDTEFENINASWWQQIKDFFLNMLHKIGFEDFRGVTLSDNELRYILWRSYENLAEPGRYRNILGEAADVAKQYELKVGNYAVSDPHHLTVAESDDALYRTGDPEIHERELARDRYERRVKSGMFQSREALQDSMLGLKEAMTAILGKETNIEDVDGFENAYLGENRLSSVNKAEADAFAHTLFKPMLDEVAKLARTEAEREELIDYMMAKHGLERNTYMRNEAINNGATDADQTDYAGLTALTGMDNITDAETEAQIMVNDYEQAHDTTDLWKKVNAASKAILSKSYECGMMSKATFDKISDMYDFYIPLRGFDEKTSSEAYAYLTHKQSAFNAPIKKAEGRRSKADDPFANLQSMAEGAIMQGNRNKLVKQRFLNFALNHSSDLVSVSDIWVEYDTVADEWKPVFPDNIDSTDTPEVVERKMLDFETKMESLAQQYPDRYKHGKDTVNIPYRIVESRDMRQHQIVVKRGGRDYVITINGNPRAAQALNGQTNPDNDMSGAIGAILRAGENINRQLSAFYTTRNPDFIVSNFMRDMLYTNTMTWIRESPNYALRFHRNYMYANPVRIKQLLAKHRKGTLDMSNKTEAMFHQFMMNGGETGYANIRDIEQHKNDIRRELKKSNGKIPVKKAWDLLGERFDEYNRAVENCARFAAFMTSREMGRSIDRAIYDAKEISVNFNKKGSGAKFYDSTGQTKAGNASALVSGLGRSGYVFWNAAIQGTANFGRQMKRHPAKAFTGIAAMFLLGAIVAYLGGDDDDDDDKNAYYNLPEYVRRSNILFRAGNSWVSIPLPVEYRAVYGMGELMISVLNGKEHLTGEEIAEAITGQATQILPIDFLEGGGGLNAFVPSAYKPLWEAYVAEKSWTGMPLYKDTPYNKDMPEWTKAYKSANKYIVGLANAMNEATGGDPYTKGTIDFNPAKIEYMLNGYFGGVFGTIDKLSKTAETITDNREYDPRSFLLVNRLVKAGDERTEYRAVNNEYFRLKEEHDRLKSRLKHYEEDTDNDIFDYAEKIDFLYNSPEYERYEIFEDYRRDIDDLYNELNDTVDDEERKNIEAELNELKKEMIEEMNKTRK